MPGLDEFRKQFGVGTDVPDDRLEEMIYNKFFTKDMTRDQFHAKITAGYQEKELKPYKKTTRDEMADFLLETPAGREDIGKNQDKQLGRQITKALVGSEGYGVTNPSLIDLFPPIASPLAEEERQKHVEEGDYFSGALDILGEVPLVGKPIATTGKWIADKPWFPYTKARQERAAAGRVAESAQKDTAAHLQGRDMGGRGQVETEDTGRLVVENPRTGRPYEAEDIGPTELKQLRLTHREPSATTPGSSFDPTPAQKREMRLMDYGGAATKEELRASTSLSASGAQETRNVITPRFQTQVDRTLGWFRSRYGNAEGSLQRLIAEREAGKTPISREYAQAYFDGNRDIITPTLVQMLNNPAIADALVQAESRLALLEAGSGIAYRGRGSTHPTLAMWDQVKRVMDDKITTLLKAGSNTEARAWVLIKNRLVKELDDVVPSYAVARGVAADYFHAATAFEAGQNVAAQKLPRGEIQAVTQRMSPAERAEFQEGFLYDYLNDTIKSVGDTSTLYTRVMQNPLAREKVVEVLGPEAAGEFATVLSVEQVLDHARIALGNSVTAQATHALNKRKGDVALPSVVGGITAIGASAMTGDWKAIAAGTIGAGITRLAQKYQEKIDEKVATRVVSMLLSDDPEVYAKGLKEVTQQNRPLGRTFQAMAAYLGSGVRGSTVPYTADQPSKGIFGSQSQPTPVKDFEEAKKLPPGTWVRVPDGRVGQTKGKGEEPARIKVQP